MTENIKLLNKQGGLTGLEVNKYLWDFAVSSIPHKHRVGTEKTR